MVNQVAVQKWCIRNTNKLSLKMCMEKIALSGLGAVFIVDSNGKALGLLTDGDVRSALIEGHTIQSDALPLANRNFKYAKSNAQREELLKLFDSQISFVPVLNENDEIVTVVDQSEISYVESESIIAWAKSPARISFGGGGSDLTQFFSQHNGATLNATVSLFAHCSVRPVSGKSITLKSFDMDCELNYESIDHIEYNGSLDLIKAIVKFMNPKFGFELNVSSEFKPHSGLGGSSAVCAAVIGALNQFRRDKLTKHEISELSFHAERIELETHGGWQDQYASVFGGFNFIEYIPNKNNEIYPLKLQEDTVSELEERLILCYSGTQHLSHLVHKEMKINFANNSHKSLEAILLTRDIAYKMKTSLLRGNIDQLGQLLNEAWQLKKLFSKNISNDALDSLYDFALNNGALGGKILGAGGGGYFLFLAEETRKFELSQKLQKLGYLIEKFGFTNSGTRSWTTRSNEVKNNNELQSSILRAS